MASEVAPKISIVDIARPIVMRRRHRASRMMATGAGAIMSNAVALRPPEEKIRNAKRARSPRRRSCVNRMVTATSHPNSAHGSNSADVRET